MTHSASVIFFLLISSHCSSKVLSGRKIPISSFGIWASKSSIANENFQWGVKLFYLNWQWFLLACLTKAWDEFTWKSHSSKKVKLATFYDPALTIFQTLIFKLKFCHSGKLQNPHFWPKPRWRLMRKARFFLHAYPILVKSIFTLAKILLLQNMALNTARPLTMRLRKHISIG